MRLLSDFKIIYISASAWIFLLLCATNCVGYGVLGLIMGVLTVVIDLLPKKMRVVGMLILIVFIFPVNALAAESKAQEGRILLIAGGLAIVLAIISLFIGILKIIILRKFSLDKEWFDYSAKKALIEISVSAGGGVNLARRLYVLLSGTARILMVAMILVVVIYFIMR